MNDWTIMVYISADEVLANFAIESLKQLQRAAGDGIAVAAQFDTNTGLPVRRFAFDGKGKTDSLLAANIVDSLESPVDMTDSKTLTGFIDWASDAYEGRHYCLILWGHGFELLLDKDPGKVSDRAYLTPATLREALEKTQLLQRPKGQAKKLDLIALDACSMSSVEVASELHGCVDFMIASQEDVPDGSFPYEHVLQQLKLRIDRDNVPGLSAAIPELYRVAYQDYLVSPGTGMKEVTLATLDLKHLGEDGPVLRSIRHLADALLAAAQQDGLRAAILNARASSRDFASGLFVDLADFCARLVDQGTGNSELTTASQEVLDTIKHGNSVLARAAGLGIESRCHGLSIYFPYLKEKEETILQALIANHTDLMGQLPLLVKGSTNILRKTREAMIGQLEEDFSVLHAFGATHWMTFIREGWSLILTAECSKELDVHYSAQQSAVNLLALNGAMGPRAVPSSTGPGGGPPSTFATDYREAPKAS